MGRFTNRPFLKALIASALGINLFVVTLLVSVFIFYEILNFNSSNAVLYLVKDQNGWIRATDDLNFDESHKLLFMIDATAVFRFLEGLAASTYHSPFIETSWNKEKGSGVLKELRPDGTKFLVVLSRYEEEKNSPKGLFIGGDLQFGDMDRINDRGRNNTGISFYNGNQWLHIWCSINESLTIKGIEKVINPVDWLYSGSRVVRSSQNEVILESSHSYSTIGADGVPVRMQMTRTLYKRKGDNYVVFKVEFTNATYKEIEYFYRWGDEPWVGEFGDSSGDVGWTSGKVFRRESYILPVIDSFAGFWDYGNDLAGEQHKFSNYANFVEWLANPPTVVYFSNSLSLQEFKEGNVLSSRDNRIINLVWLNEHLKPGETKSHVLALGMAKPDQYTGFPVKPEVHPHTGIP
ncbi:MAG: hypothetical protein ACM34I_02585 [bacterium]